MKKYFIALIIVLSCFLFSCKSYVQYSDTNGDDNYELESITDEMIVKQNKVLKMLAVTNQESKDGTTEISISVGRFDGVEKEYTFKKGSYTIEIDFTVNKGNARLVICNAKEIIYDFKVNETSQKYELNINETHYLKLVGESANISLKIKIEK